MAHTALVAQLPSHDKGSFFLGLANLDLNKKKGERVPLGYEVAEDDTPLRLKEAGRLLS